MNSESNQTPTKMPVRRSDTTVGELLTTWQVKKPTYTLSPRLNAYVVILVSILLFSLILYFAYRLQIILFL